jgi:Secretion system C-terminal sorting domain
MKNYFYLIVSLFLSVQSLNAQVVLGRPLIVPEFCTGMVKFYNTDNPTTVKATHTLDLPSLLCANAKPNSCAVQGNDLFVSVNVGCQRLYKFTDYINLGFMAPFTQINNVNTDYVGMTFNAAGNLYTAQGSYLDNYIVSYTSTMAGAGNTYIGNAGKTSYFANLAFDAAGNLWVSDYQNHRIVVSTVGNINFITNYREFNTVSDFGNIPVGNTTAGLNGNVNTLLSRPEGIAFDAAGNLWVGNNNDNGTNNNGTVVKITPDLQAAILATAVNGSYTPTTGQANQANGYTVYNLPNPAAGNSNCFGIGAAARSQCGGVIIDKVNGMMYVNEQQGNQGFMFSLADMATIANTYSTYAISMTSNNPGNGGIAFGVNSAVLSTDLVSIKAAPQYRAISINWQTANEQNMIDFGIERSMDGLKFEQIGTVKATNAPNIYNYKDATAQDNMLYYYRIAMRDKGGKTEYSKIVTASLSGKTKTVSVFPNPAKDVLNISGIEPTDEWQVVDIIGKTRATYKGPQTLDLAGFGNGIYFIKIGNENRSRFVVSK